MTPFIPLRTFWIIIVTNDRNRTRNCAVWSKIEMSELIALLGLSYFTPKNLMRILILKVNVIVLQQNRQSKYRFLSILHRSFFLLLFVVSLDNSFYSVEDSNNLINFKYQSAQNNAKANMIFFSHFYASYTFYQANSFSFTVIIATIIFNLIANFKITMALSFWT